MSENHNDYLLMIARELEKLNKHLSEFLARQNVTPEKQVSTKKMTTVEETNNISIEYEERTYSRFKPCKYKCGNWSSFADDYKKGDRPLHINPLTKEILGFQCPKYT